MYDKIISDFSCKMLFQLDNYLIIPEFLLGLWGIFSILFYINYRILNKNITSSVITFFTNISIIYYLFISIYLIFLSFKFYNNTYFYKSFLIFNFYTIMLKIILLFFSIIVIFFLKVWLIKIKRYILEYYFLVTGSLIFMFLMISSINLFGIYIALEGISLQLYALTALSFTEISVEIALKYFLLGSLISGIILYGITLIYGNIFSLNIFVIKNFILNNNLLENNLHINITLSCKLGFILLLLGFFFKLGIYPFHIWVVGVYSNTPTPITYFFTTAVKFVFFFLFLNLYFAFDFFSILKSLKILLVFCIISSIIFGATGAYKENRIKSFIGYTSINQIGFLLLGFCSLNQTGILASIIYIFIYLTILTGFFSFILINYQRYTNRPLIFFSDIKYFNKDNPLLYLIFSSFILSFSGLPPFAGFFSKYYIYVSLIKSNHFLLLVLALFLNLISLHYYIRIIKNIWFENLVEEKSYFLDFNEDNIDFFWILLIISLSTLNFILLFLVNLLENTALTIFYSLLIIL